MFDGPVRITITVEGRVGLLISKAEVPSAIQVEQDTICSNKKFGSRLGHGPAEISDRESDVRARVGRTIQERGDQALVLAQESRITYVLASECIGHELWKRFVAGAAISLSGRWDAVRMEGFDHALDVLGLTERHATLGDVEVDAKKVGQVPLVLHFPGLERLK